MALPFQNQYTLRRVAESSAKACFICYRQSTSVLITPDQADFFYVCPGHLTDKGFATPVRSTEEELEAKRKELLAKEVEKVKAEYEEKQRRKKEKDREKDREKDKDKDDEKKKDEGKEKKSPEPDKKDESDTPKPPESKVFTLNRKIFDLRVNRARQALQAKRNAERLRNPSLFPTPPKGDPV